MAGPMVPQSILYWLEEAVPAVFAGRKPLEKQSWGWSARVYIYGKYDKDKTDIIRVDITPPKEPS